MRTQQVRRYSTALVVSVMYAFIAYPLLASEQIYFFDVPKTSADIALNKIAQQADVQVLFPFDKVRLIETNELSGAYTLVDALRFLLEGTGISADFTESGIMRVEVNRNQFRLDKECRICVMSLLR